MRCPPTTRALSYWMIVWALWYHPVVSLVPPSVPATRGRSNNGHLSRCMVAMENDYGSGDIRRSTKKSEEERTLYDVLGASPKDSHEQLKVKYMAIAKALHPDANPNSSDSPYGDGTHLYYDLSEINAAWKVLKDRKERMRYDRSLQAKEFADGVEALVGLGIKTAIPFFQKTADTTVAAMDASAKAAQEGAEQARLAYGAFELEQQIRTLEQKAATEANKAKRLEKELKILSTKKVETLRKEIPQQKQFSSAEAQRILNSFIISNEPATNPPSSLVSDIDSLSSTEQEHRDSIRTRQSMERAAQAAVRKVQQAVKAEELAIKRLAEAQRALQVAQNNSAMALNFEKQARTEEAAAQQSLIKVETTLQKEQEKVRLGLLRQQDIFLDKKAQELKQGKQACELNAKNLRSEADKLKKVAKKLE